MSFSVNVEAYTENKYVSATGNAICEKSVRKCGHDFVRFLDAYMVKPEPQKPKVTLPGSFLSDAAVIDLAMSAANSEKFRKLWNGDTAGYASQSEADLALCSILAFYCGGDTGQIDRLMRMSDLSRDKWDRDDYSKRTIEKAVSGTSEFYKPIAASAASQDFNDVAQKLISLNVLSNRRYTGNDIGFGRLFADVFKDVARFVTERKKWFVFDGTRWVADSAGLLVTELGKELADALLIYASTIHDEEKRSLILSWCKKWVQRRFRDVYIREAQSVYPISVTVLDKDEYLFNCANCTVDIRTGKTHEHSWLYMANMLLGLMWVAYLSTRLNGSFGRKHRIVLNRVVAVGALLLIINIFTPIVFGVDAQNNYYRTWVYYLYMAADLLIVADGVVIYLATRRLMRRFRAALQELLTRSMNSTNQAGSLIS